MSGNRRKGLEGLEQKLATVSLDERRIGCTDGAIGQRSGRDGNSAEESRAEQEQE